MTTKEKSKRELNENERVVLSTMVDNISTNAALNNGHIRKQFSLQNVIMHKNRLMKKSKMIDELAEYDNLIKAMGAFFYTSKKMSDVVPVVF